MVNGSIQFSVAGVLDVQFRRGSVVNNFTDFHQQIGALTTAYTSLGDTLLGLLGSTSTALSAQLSTETSQAFYNESYITSVWCAWLCRCHAVQACCSSATFR